MSKILIVEDEMKIRQIYAKLLTLERHEVYEAEDCTAAARYLVNDRQIDLILLDINLPELDAGVLYRMIRMLDSRVKVIVTSAYPLQEQRSRIPKADDYYDKAQSTLLLVQKVRHALSRQRDHALDEVSRTAGASSV